MATVTTNDLRVMNAKNFISSLNTADGDARSYVFIGRPNEWERGDTRPPTPGNNWREFYETYDEMLSLQRIGTTDAYHMLRRDRWTSGVTFDMYKADYSKRNKSYSGASNLYDSRFYVINSTNQVYVCLNNNNNLPSTVEPTNETNSPFTLGDGYQWVRLFRITDGGMQAWSTEDYIPIAPATKTDSSGSLVPDIGNTIDGSVYTVIIDRAGANYTNNPPGAVNALDSYYCRITGDGRNAIARVKVSGGEVRSIQVVEPGFGYTEATVNFTAGNCYASKAALDKDMNALNPLGDGTFKSSVIISPPGGWGTDIARELGGTRVGVFSLMGDTGFDFIEGVKFRQIGIIQDPELHPSTLPNAQTLSASYAILYTPMSGVVKFKIGETIEETVIVDGVTKTARGTVVNWDEANEIVKYIQDPTLHADADGNLYRFGAISAETDNQVLIYGLDSNTVITPQDSTGTKADLTFVDGFAAPEIMHYTGMMTYLTNQPPVLRVGQQSERISLVIAY